MKTLFTNTWNTEAGVFSVKATGHMRFVLLMRNMCLYRQIRIIYFSQHVSYNSKQSLRLYSSSNSYICNCSILRFWESLHKEVIRKHMCESNDNTPQIQVLIAVLQIAMCNPVNSYWIARRWVRPKAYWQSWRRVDAWLDPHRLNLRFLFPMTLCNYTSWAHLFVSS